MNFMYEVEPPGSDDQPSPFRRGEAEPAREHMFDKVVTPSDVGKLNRLVIPKQHAEKYFPLDSTANEKGLLLNFEDRSGKPWRFRYSYWNSSQSYVMTKGWSRFVKEKKLDAGDIVSFQRGLGDLGKDRLFIDWRRRPDAPPDLQYNTVTPWGPLLMQQPTTRDNYHYSSHLLQPSNHHHHRHHHHPYGGTIVNGNPCPPGSIMYLRGGGGGGGGVLAGSPQMPLQKNMVFESVPVVQGKAAAKRLRLFGVNMDCPISADDSDNNNIIASTPTTTNNNECDILLMSSSTSTIMPSPYQAPFDSSSSSSSSSLARFRHNDDIDKGKGSMSLDLDI